MRFLIDLLSIFAVPHITIQKDGHGGKEKTDVIDGGCGRMKLIIDIPEETKQAFDKAESNDLKGSYYDHGGVIGHAIKNGTPLDDVKAEIRELRDSWEKDCYHDEAEALNIALKIIDKHIGNAESEGSK